jgi:type VI protein secretion system component VasK
MIAWRRFLTWLRRRRPLDTPDGWIVNVDVMRDGSLRKGNRGRESRVLCVPPAAKVPPRHKSG